MSRDSFDNTAQGWAEITQLLTVAGGYIPTLNPPGALIENTCEGRTILPVTYSHVFCRNKAKEQKKASYLK